MDMTVFFYTVTRIHPFIILTLTIQKPGKYKPEFQKYHEAELIVTILITINQTSSLLMLVCFGKNVSTSTSATIDSLIASSWVLLIIFTAYSRPESRDTHFLTVLDSPL